jgi:hypothetical protein
MFRFCSGVTWSRESSVGMAKGCVLDCRGSILSWGKSFSLLHSVHTASRAHPASYTTGTGVKAGREADHSPPSSAEVKRKIPTLPICLHSVVLNYLGIGTNLALNSIWRRVVCLVATQQTTRRHIPEDDTFHNHRCGNLKFYKLYLYLQLSLWEVRV